MTKADHEHLAVVRRVAKLHGVQPTYMDAFGSRRAAGLDSLVRVLATLGVDASTARDSSESEQAQKDRLLRRPLQPVTVVWRGSAGRAAVVPPAEKSKQKKPTVTCALTLESGESRVWAAEIGPGAQRERRIAGVGVRREAVIDLPKELPEGYHRLVVDLGGQRHESLVICAPKRSFAHERGVYDREWGLFCPIYALRSAPGREGGPNLGCGDLTDLRDMAAWSSAHGGRVVATLPLLSALNGERGGPFDPSPYAPVSRLFWNELFVDPARAPGFSENKATRELLASRAVQREAEALRRMDAVDYRRCAKLKRSVLESMARAFFASGSSSQAPFKAFLAERPLAEPYALFRAVTEGREEPWSKWPSRMRGGSLRAPDAVADRVQYHLYAQFAAEEQLQAFSRETRARGGLVYLDLPVGVSPYGFDVWRNQGLFAMGCSTGAPPDPYFTGGQDWGFPPVRPDAYREQGYAYFIESLRNHMRHSDYLRLDHVMAFHRLFWIPDGMGAADGLYVHYEAEEFYAILSLESHRNRCRLVGENLGTVPPQVNKAIDRHDLCGLFVGQYELQPNPARALRPVPANCVASVNTHDMPPLAKHWDGSDIDDRIALKMLDPTLRERERESRHRMNSALVKFMTKKGLLKASGESAPLDRVRDALHAYIASSDADFALFNIEDLWLENRWQNIPGTVDEHANWRHKLRHTLGELGADKKISAMLREIDRHRRGNGREKPAAGSGGSGGSKKAGGKRSAAGKRR